MNKLSNRFIVRLPMQQFSDVLIIEYVKRAKNENYQIVDFDFFGITSVKFSIKIRQSKKEVDRKIEGVQSVLNANMYTKADSLLNSNHA